MKFFPIRQLHTVQYSNRTFKAYEDVLFSGVAPQDVTVKPGTPLLKIKEMQVPWKNAEDTS